jgi:hypothetical protein
MKRPGGFPRINRPAPVPTAAVEAKPVDAAAQQAPRTGFPRLPTRPVMPAPAAVKYDAPHDTMRPAPPHLPAAEPIDEFFADGDQDAVMDDGDSAEPDDLSADSLDVDPDDAPIITVPVQPLPRPPPTVAHPTPASRTPRPPVRQPGSGLLARPRPVFQPPSRPRPSFLPPSRERPALPPPAPPPAVAFPRTQAKAPPPPARDVPRPAPARPVFQPPAAKVEAKPAAPAAKALPRASMHEARKFQKRPGLACKVDPAPPTKIHEGYMGRMDLIDPEEIPF